MNEEEVLMDCFLNNDEVFFQYLIETKLYSYDVLQMIYEQCIQQKKWNFLAIYQKIPYRFHYLLTFDDYNVEEAIILNKLTNFRHSYYIFEYLLEQKTSAIYLKMFMSYHDSYFLYKLFRIVELKLEDLIHLLNELPSDMRKYQMELINILRDTLLTCYHSNYLEDFIKQLIDYYGFKIISDEINQIVEGNNIPFELIHKLNRCGIQVYNLNDSLLNLQLK